MENNTLLDFALLLLGSSTITTLITWIIQRRQKSAETDNTTVKTALELVETLRVRVKELEDDSTRDRREKEEIKAQLLKLSDTYAMRITELERSSREKDNTIDGLTERVRRLEGQIISLNQTPVK